MSVAVLVTAASTVALVMALGAVNAQLDRLVSAQTRLELLSTISGRIGDYALMALQAGHEQPGAERTPLRSGRVLAAERARESFVRLETALADYVGRLVGEEQRTLMAARSRTIARLRAQFEILDRQIDRALASEEPATAARVALDVFAAGFGGPLSQAMEEERTTALDAYTQVRELRERTIRWGLIGVALACLLAVTLYHLLGRSLVKRVADVAAAAAAIARGRTDTRVTVTGHDELSLAMARFNRMASHLARREQRLVAAQRHLQETVDARTAELRAANRRLEDVDLARRRFFTDVSHELRTPLTVILGEVEITLRPARPREEDLRAALLVIQSRARRLHRRVEDLLRIARSESGQIELDRSLFPVSDLLADVRESMMPVARAAGLTLETSCAPDDLAIDADRDWLRQTFDGLVANAVRHSPYGETVRLEAQRDGDEVLIRLRDRGTGIAPEELPHVFERFWRGTSGTREGTGFGIGLALAKWIVDRHGGRIEIESGMEGGTEIGAEGASGRMRGTCVSVRLPVPVPDMNLEAAQ
ncbi:ATP-binding protein [Starkeya koreensis]|uniref:histidine kinase n=1 Tax=Ancylobacter koreensis TaxID=266121 RepID=A0ABT0DN54_9HYPH|nr:HAMP domain-containing sensor histidine kinase [Ancylobacter koreensis]MCK0208708.1 ATP-binding protein [Ancylobacter koreensis]